MWENFFLYTFPNINSVLLKFGDGKEILFQNLQNIVVSGDFLCHMLTYRPFSGYREDKSFHIFIMGRRYIYIQTATEYFAFLLN